VLKGLALAGSLHSCASSAPAYGPRTLLACPQSSVSHTKTHCLLPTRAVWWRADRGAQA